MAKRNVTVEGPDGARISIWTDDEGGITVFGSATSELRKNPELCAGELLDVFSDAVGTFFANVIMEEQS